MATKSKWEGSRNCWFCGRQLQTKTGGGYHFALIEDPAHNQMRVHKDCVKMAIGDGYREVKDVRPAQ